MLLLPAKLGGGMVAKDFLAAANIGTKGAIGELGAAIKGLGQGRLPPLDLRRGQDIQFRQDLTKSYTRVDQRQRSMFTGKQTLVEAKYSSSGVPRLSPAQ